MVKETHHISQHCECSQVCSLTLLSDGVRKLDHIVHRAMETFSRGPEHQTRAVLGSEVNEVRGVDNSHLETAQSLPCRNRHVVICSFVITLVRRQVER